MRAGRERGLRWCGWEEEERGPGAAWGGPRGLEGRERSSGTGGEGRPVEWGERAGKAMYGGWEEAVPFAEGGWRGRLEAVWREEDLLGRERGSGGVTGRGEGLVGGTGWDGDGGREELAGLSSVGGRAAVWGGGAAGRARGPGNISGCGSLWGASWGGRNGEGAAGRGRRLVLPHPPRGFWGDPPSAQRWGGGRGARVLGCAQRWEEQYQKLSEMVISVSHFIIPG